MKIYNTMSRRVEDFKTIKKGQVKMYVCGPTPYDKSHIGHARTYVFFDFLRRFLEFEGQKVKLVVNLTDVDDKIIKRAAEFDSWQVVPDLYSRYFFWMLEKLKIKEPATFPTVTAHMPEIIELVQKLVEKGFAYKLKDGIYFDVSKFQEYGKLSKVKLDDPKISRVEPAPGKKNPADFAVWKFRKKGEPYWCAPFGEGRPGWHIECSAMSTCYLGEQFDIHGGGADLAFPHHENEIAQSEAATGKSPWVNYWVHVAFLTIAKEKMSKSLKNIIGIDELVDAFPPEVLRYYLLSAHYRTQLDFTWEKVKKGREQWDKIARAWFEILQRKEQGIYGKDDVSKEVELEFKRAIQSLEDDLKTPDAYANIHFIASLVLSNDPDKASVEKAHEVFRKLDDIFAFLPQKSWTPKELKLAEELAELREKLRKDKKFALSDKIRERLSEQGITIEDTKSGGKVKFEP
ncbi:cysteine--tRNA ligase [Candidatus Bathyarchaeota archaeon]|nr:cysteine--tRNA ligase [Candidatus Bathyarchaeota archaeon]